MLRSETTFEIKTYNFLVLILRECEFANLACLYLHILLSSIYNLGSNGCELPYHILCIVYLLTQK